MTRLIILGDLHGDLAPLQACRHEADAMVLLGDLGLTEPLRPPEGAPPVYYIHGNHDADHEDYWNALIDSPAASLHARTASIGDVRAAGLGGVFRGQVWRPEPPREARLPSDPEAGLEDYPGVRCARRSDWRRYRRRRHQFRHHASIWPEDFAALRGERAEVLVLHEAPSYHRHGFRVLDDLADEIGASLVVHGHHHRWTEAETATGAAAVAGVARGGAMLAERDAEHGWRLERAIEGRDRQPRPRATDSASPR